MNHKTKGRFTWQTSSLIMQTILVIPVMFVLSPCLVYLVLKLSHNSKFPAIIKVQKISPVLKSMYEYRFHPELTAKNKTLQIINKLLEKYSLLTAFNGF